MLSNPLATIKSGLARIRVSADNSKTRTRLTELAHRAPSRLIPIQSSSVVNRSGACLVALSSYGGGMLSGDSSDLYIQCEESTTLSLTTQGPTRIYQQHNNTKQQEASSLLFPSDSTCRSKIRATIDKDALLVLAPDYSVAFRNSFFEQDIELKLVGDLSAASVVSIDWWSAGRVLGRKKSERWEFRSVSSTTRLVDRHGRPILMDSVLLDRRHQDDLFGFGDSINAFASILLHGHKTNRVVEQCKALSTQFAALYTRVKQHNEEMDSPLVELPKLAGRVLMGVSASSNDSTATTTMVRLTAQSNEDIYRVLHACLLPLKQECGYEFYRDRISAVSPGAIPAIENNEKQRHINEASHRKTVFSSNNHLPSSDFPSSTIKTSWVSYMLADSAFPVGGFAHSAGIEAAAQLGVFSTISLQSYMAAAAKSAVQFQVPFVMAGHDIGIKLLSNNADMELLYETWKERHIYIHASLASNAPACQASLEQGSNLLRVSLLWLNNMGTEQTKTGVELLRRLQKGVISGEIAQGLHLAPLFGLTGSLLGLDVAETSWLFAFCLARDMGSAAVRLNLVGPLENVSLLYRLQDAVEKGMETVKQRDGDDIMDVIKVAATCAPVAETIHPCHELLAVRLFRT